MRTIYNKIPNPVSFNVAMLTLCTHAHHNFHLCVYLSTFYGVTYLPHFLCYQRKGKQKQQYIVIKEYTTILANNNKLYAITSKLSLFMCGRSILYLHGAQIHTHMYACIIFILFFFAAILPFAIYVHSSWQNLFNFLLFLCMMKQIHILTLQKYTYIYLQTCILCVRVYLCIFAAALKFYLRLIDTFR